MNILVAMDSFKGSMSSKALSETIKRHLIDINNTLNVKNVPIADGGEGTVEALAMLKGFKYHTISVHNPLMNPIEVTYGQIGDTAIMEMASCSGLNTIDKEDKNPALTSTYGLGEMIIDAVNKGMHTFIIGLGGSATNDGGMGVLSAFGYAFYDENNNPLQPVGKNLIDITSIVPPKVSPLPSNVHFKLACDVINPFYGPNGAAAIFGPQKGADKHMVSLLDKGMQHYANLIKKLKGIDLQSIAGSGAAGGLSAAFLPFYDTTIKSGISFIFDEINLEENIKEADVIITGEGKIDGQTLSGKAPFGVVQLAKKHNKTVIVLCGKLTYEGKVLSEYGATVIKSIHDPNVPWDDAMMAADYTSERLKQTLQQLSPYFKNSI